MIGSKPLTGPPTGMWASTGPLVVSPYSSCLVAQRLSIPRLTGLERLTVEVRRPLPRHGTDHDSKPLPSFPRFCLPARPLQCRQEEYRSGRATAQGFGRSLLVLPFAGARLRPA